MTRKRDDLALWRAIQDAELDDDLAEIEAMSDADLDAYLTAHGGDPAKIRADGEALAKRLLARRADDERELGAKLEAFRAHAASLRKAAPRPRAELLAALAAARTSPRFSAPVAMLFQKKTPEASTDEELQALVDAIELLEKLNQG